MPVYRVAAATYAIQTVAPGGTGSVIDSAGFIGGARFGATALIPLPKPNKPFFAPIQRVLSGSGTGAADCNGEATVAVAVAMTGRPGNAECGWRKRNMPAAKAVLSPAPTTIGGFER